MLVNKKLAEGQGFEPWKGVNPCWFSRPVLSTAQPSLQLTLFVRKGYSVSSITQPASLSTLDYAGYLKNNQESNEASPTLSGKPRDRGVTAKDNRLFVEAVLWIARTGASWRDLPKPFGPWSSGYQRSRRWADKGVFRERSLRGYQKGLILRTFP